MFVGGADGGEEVGGATGGEKIETVGEGDCDKV